MLRSIAGRRILLALAALFLAWLSLIAWITVTGKRTELRKVDCIIVPGARVEADGRPGLSLTARLDRAVEVYSQGWATGMVFTGGKGDTGYVEGQVGRDYAVARGVPAEACDFEDQSRDTHQNFYYAKRVMDRHGWHSCLIVTDPFHSHRCLLLAGDLGLEAYPAPTFNGPSSSKWGSWAFYTIRETFSYAKYLWER